ncbi:hypothetical protein OSTOST_16163 [Ostertagia ostertagi]
MTSPLSNLQLTWPQWDLAVVVTQSTLEISPIRPARKPSGIHFSRAGQVTNVRIVYDRETGRMKGFGFCEFSDEAGANNAVNTLNGSDFDGRQLRVNLANRN